MGRAKAAPTVAAATAMRAFKADGLRAEWPGTAARAAGAFARRRAGELLERAPETVGFREGGCLARTHQASPE